MVSVQVYTFFAVFLHEQTSPLLTFVGHSEVGGGGVLTHTGTAHLAAVGQTGVQNYHLVHSLAQLLDLDPEMKKNRIIYRLRHAKNVDLGPFIWKFST